MDHSILPLLTLLHWRGGGVFACLVSTPLPFRNVTSRYGKVHACFALQVALTLLGSRRRTGHSAALDANLAVTALERYDQMASFTTSTRCSIVNDLCLAVR